MLLLYNLLEPYAGKLARTVLRGEGASNGPDLPDKVKDILTYYHCIREISEKQILLVKEYSRAWNGVRQDAHFSREEIEYIGNVYSGIIEESVKNLEQVSLVINAFTTQMTDARRMEIINAASNAIDQNYNDLRAFNTQTIGLTISRAKDAHDVTVIKNLYGIQ